MQATGMRTATLNVLDREGTKTLVDLSGLRVYGECLGFGMLPDVQPKMKWLVASMRTLPGHDTDFKTEERSGPCD
jgi:hypothetical protein